MGYCKEFEFDFWHKMPKITAIFESNVHKNYHITTCGAQWDGKYAAKEFVSDRAHQSFGNESSGWTKKILKKIYI